MKGILGKLRCCTCCRPRSTEGVYPANGLRHDQANEGDHASRPASRCVEPSPGPRRNDTLHMTASRSAPRHSGRSAVTSENVVSAKGPDSALVHCRRRAAFTLAELLVVIAIIVLLMAILVPVLRRVRSQARATVCKSNLRQWSLIFEQYLGGHDGKWFTSSSWEDEPWPWLMLDYYQPSIKDASISLLPNEVLICPEAPNRQRWRLCTQGGQGTMLNVFGGTNSVWGSGLGGAEPYFRGISSYGMNMWTIQPGYHPENLGRERGVVPVLFDCRWERAYVSAYEPPPADEPPRESTLCRDFWSAGCSLLGLPRSTDSARELSRSARWLCMDRHSGGINMLFMDWSVRKVGVKELWALKWCDHFDTTNKWTRAGGVRPEDWPEWMRAFKDY